MGNLISKCTIPRSISHEEAQPESDGATFPFDKLPPEIRWMIWTEVTLQNRRLITSYRYFFGGKFLPEPPVTSRICRESRLVALHLGSMRTLRGYCNRGWFNPSVDIFMTIPQSSSVDSKVEHLALLYRVRIPRPPVDGTADAMSIIGGIALAPNAKNPNLRTIDLVPVYAGPACLEAKWNPTAVENIFGSNTILTVDLRDERAVSHAIGLLQQHRSARQQLDLLTVAHYAMKGYHPHILAWDPVVKMAQRKWLESRWVRDRRSESDAFPATHENPWDPESPWVKKTRAEMPEFRPIFMLVKLDHTWVPERHRGMEQLLEEIE